MSDKIVTCGKWYVREELYLSLEARLAEAERLLARVGRDLIAMGTCDDEITAFLARRAVNEKEPHRE